MDTPEKPFLPTAEGIRGHILSAIESGEYGPGDKLPTEAELRVTFSTSRHTMRKVLTDLASRGVVQSVVGKGTFVTAGLPEAGAGGLSPASVSTPTVGLVVPTIRDSFLGSIVASLEGELAAKGMSILLAYTNHEQGEEEKRLSQLAADGVCGIVIFTSDCSPEQKDKAVYLGLGVPLVFIDRYIADVPGDRVLGRDRQAGVDAARHLLDHGRTRLGFYADAVAALGPVQERLRGLVAAAEERGLEVSPAHIIDRLAPGTDPRSAVRRLLEEEPRPDAIVAANDDAAARIYGVCAEMGLCIPADLAVIGFTNSDFGRYLNPPLTSVDQNPWLIGKHAADLLCARITGRAGQTDAEITERVAYKLVIRCSCGCEPSVEGTVDEL